MLEFHLYEGNRLTGQTVHVGSGTHNAMGDKMDRLRHRPTAKGAPKPFHMLYSNKRLVSTTY